MATSAQVLRTAVVSRNDALEFARRTRRNLLFIEDASQRNSEIHPVTQLANSLLGLVVFPWERNFVKKLERMDLAPLVQKGWPAWAISRGTAGTLGELVRHLRNAVAHGHLTFSSDNSFGEVAIEVADYRLNRTEPYWCATISAKELRAFCLALVDLLEDTIG